jgi:hypothetical protein
LVIHSATKKSGCVDFGAQCDKIQIIALVRIAARIAALAGMDL